MEEKEDLVLMGYANLETVTSSVFPSSVRPPVHPSSQPVSHLLTQPPVQLYLLSAYVGELVSVCTFVTLLFMYFLSPPAS